MAILVNLGSLASASVGPVMTEEEFEFDDCYEDYYDEDERSMRTICSFCSSPEFDDDWLSKMN